LPTILSGFLDFVCAQKIERVHVAGQVLSCTLGLGKVRDNQIMFSNVANGQAN
jgi:hypothetical protein